MPEAGDRLGPYVVLRRLGEGGMGEVFLARDTRLDREVALKLLPADLAADPARLSQFRQEALTLAALNHPNIATIYGFEEPAPGQLFLALERVDGETLHERIARKPPTVEEALQVCAQIAEALEAAHDQGIVHRDLKPRNVMIGPRGLVKVLDFGLARARGATSGSAAPAGGADLDQTIAPSAADATVGESGIMEGTPGYMSPEQVRGGAQDERTDLFAFGCVLYECLTARRAFLGESIVDTLRAVLDSDPDWTALPERLPARVRDLLVRSLDKDPARRPAKAREARHELEEALGIRRAAALRAGEVAATPSNLPRAISSFIGRDEEVKACVRLVAEHRLVTLTGMGGTGKTRLAIESAERSLDAFPDGVWFVDLAPVTDAGRVETTVAAAVGVREEPGQALVESLVSHLHNRRTLVVLDNCEEVRRACAGLAATVLRTCPEVRILATSRESLEAQGEVTHAVGTLATPSADAPRTAAEAGRYDAVRLFVERARAAAPSFALTDANAATVADVCRSLDGIPLALELAAARAKILSVDQIRAKLDDRFRLLTSAGRGGLTRHQTLLATIQWSFDQLDERERELMRRFAAFVGGWSLEAAAALAGADADEFEVLDVLSRLVDRSLVVVVRQESESMRYRTLESVRQFTLERLREAGGEKDARDRHLAFFLDLAEVAEAKLTGPEQGQWFDRLAADHENLLGALAWCARADGGAERGLRMAGALARFWTVRGHYEQGRRALETAIAAPGDGADSAARATALVRLGAILLYQGDYDAAHAPLVQALGLYRERGDERGEVRALGTLGVVDMYRGTIESARKSFEDALTLYRKQGNERGVAVATHNLGSSALQLGQPESARPRFEEALALFRKIGDRSHCSLSLGDLSIANVRLGRMREAWTQLGEALEIVEELTAKREGANALAAAAEFALALGRPDEAARWLGASEALRAIIGSPPAPYEKADLDRLLARMRESLGEEGLAAALAEARVWSFDDAIGNVRAWMSSVSTNIA